MSLSLYYIICGVLAILVILGIWMMSQVKTSVQGNLLSAFGLFSGVLVTLIHYEILSVVSIYIFMLVGLSIGFYMYRRVKMIQMPQMVALLNGVGGAASAIVGALSLIGVGNALTEYPVFSNITASLALVIGVITLVGSLIAAGKLHRILPQKPVVFNNHGALTKLSLLGSLVAVALAFFIGKDVVVISNPYFILIIGILFSAAFGYIFAIRVGGADMPITISLLNSLSGVAGAVAGMAIGHILLVAVGGVVGASGLLLTQIMCRAMNRNLLDILTGKTSAPKQKGSKADVKTEVKAAPAKTGKPKEKQTAATVLADAKSVIIVPGYGMALAQAQHLVKQLVDQLEQNGTTVKYAIHPVAGRMPGHMNVLLAEADVSYEQLYEMDAVNDEFKNVDAVVVIGANDVMNPSARDAKDTPIYGMPILNVDEAKNVIVCNFDLKPGYAGVDNPIYTKSEGVFLELGDAKKTIQELLKNYNSALTRTEKTASASDKKEITAGSVLACSKSVIIVPGYGMALAQAQHQVKQLADQLEQNGADVKYAIHPVAGRMPGHMNVLLAEADVPYEKLYEMDAVNDEFKNVDAVVVIGANDVLNPSARDAKDTPIYGMPILNVDEAKNVIVCNFDLKPGYAGVENPIYTKSEGVFLQLGDAKKTVQQLLMDMNSAKAEAESSVSSSKKDLGASSALANAKSVIIVPGYGMALAQAQHLVKQLADQLELNGAEVKYAIHPVAGRMPGHMNVLLAEADVPYEQLYEMDAVNEEFKNVDAVVVIGANDVLNPSARDAKDTPIYGMPILNVDEAKNIIICNFDLNPGYAGVDNPLYTRKEGVSLRLGDAKETVKQLLTELQDDQPCFDTEFETDLEKQAPIAGAMLAAAHSVIIVPGYGMALAQAQHLVKQLADQLELNGAKVKYAIHPVAGRMPGHMNVLLAEADVPYDQLYEMDVVNEEFENTDAVVVIGANDVLNPAARDAVDTPIYGMPILNVDKAKNIIICNFDLNPGYAGVDNPIYKRDEGVVLKLGDAKETLQNLLTELQTAQTAIDTSVADSAKSLSPMASGVLAAAHSVIIVPGYGMALAQAQHLVKQLADQLETNGAEVKFAIHPVAGRMPGHMNVLLAEADVPYDQLYEMDAVNEEFKNVDAVVVIGANDVLNPAARDAVDTPIYGMPILNVDEAKEVIICNFDLNPGYAGVNNPLYEREEGVHIKLGDAKETLQELLKELQNIQRNESV